jgi:hypothetical protein
MPISTKTDYKAHTGVLSFQFNRTFHFHAENKNAHKEALTTCMLLRIYSQAHKTEKSRFCDGGNLEATINFSRKFTVEN